MVFKLCRELRAALFDNAPAAVTKLLPIVLAAAPVEALPDTATAPASMLLGTALAMVEIIIAHAVVRVHGDTDAVMPATIFRSLQA